MLVSFCSKAQGISHIEKNIPCQDSADGYLDRRKATGLAVVADGHGGAKHFRSHIGSSLAVTISSKTLFDFCGTIARDKSAFYNRKIKNKEQRDKEITAKLIQLAGNIIYKWRNDVLEHLTRNPLTESELEICKTNNVLTDDNSNLILLYGTTLIAALIAEDYWFALQIGDGTCVSINDSGVPSVSIPEDDRLAFGRTTSLCDSEALDNFRYSFGFERIKGITVATDGVADSFEPQKYLDFNTDLYRNFSNIPEKAQADLQDFLPRLSERGSRDDVAIAGIFRVGQA